MISARSIVLKIFVPAATSSIMVIRTLGSPATSTRLLLLMVIDYFNGYVLTRILCIVV
jgi:hypothetical protein